MAALGNGYNGGGTITPWGGYQLECECVSVSVCVWRRRGIGMQLIGAGLSNDLRENPSIP